MIDDVIFDLDQIDRRDGSGDRTGEEKLVEKKTLCFVRETVDESPGETVWEKPCGWKPCGWNRVGGIVWVESCGRIHRVGAELTRGTDRGAGGIVS